MMNKVVSNTTATTHMMNILVGKTTKTTNIMNILVDKTIAIIMNIAFKLKQIIKED